ncbi:hypothetical protein BGZ70_007350 [Mortierella alpina]|uniref:FAS1 domain-containing protein n=1 Tax=Mortierella alpina TaxID=64518 RepID=A0A9P6J6J6_MORAP|nr:hypothetical protein BGZ70_007350 [Mortierella alpina]
MFRDSDFDQRPLHQAERSTAATILDILGARPEFSKLLELIQKDKDLTKLLADPGTQASLIGKSSTLFAPTNEAFDSVSDIDYPTRDVLMYHISDRAYNSSSLHEEHVIKSLYESPGLNNAAQLLRVSLEEPRIPSTSLRSSLWGVEPKIWIPDVDEDDTTETQDSGLYINRAKVTIPDLMAQSGAVVHGINRIIKPPGETVLDEITRRGIHFSYLVKAWTETGVDLRVRESKGVTLFAAPDKAWKGLSKKLMKYLFSNHGREHLKIFMMYQVANRAVYTPEIFNKTLEDGSHGEHYHEIALQTMLHSPRYQLIVQAKERKAIPIEALRRSKIDYKPMGAADLIEAYDDSMDRLRRYSHHRSHDRDRRRRHSHYDAYQRYEGGGDHKLPHPSLPKPRRDEIIVNKHARVEHGYENWIAGNGVIHVVDRVLMPPRSKGCENMSTLECAAWETIWDLGHLDFESVVEDATSWWEDMELLRD